MKKFCTFHAQEGHATEECERNNPSWRKNLSQTPQQSFEPLIQEVVSPPTERSVTSSVTKQERWKKKNPKWNEHRRDYMRAYRAKNLNKLVKT